MAFASTVIKVTNYEPKPVPFELVVFDFYYLKDQAKWPQLQITPRSQPTTLYSHTAETQ